MTAEANATRRDMGTFIYPAMDRVHFGKPFVETLIAELERLGSRRAFLVAAGSLASKTDLVSSLERALGARHAGTSTRIGAHTPRADVIAAANAARECGADAIVAFGGGSVIDASKMIRLCLANDVSVAGQLDAFVTVVDPSGQRHHPPMRPTTLPLLVVPTTLSAGEYTPYAGCTDVEKGLKQSFDHPTLVSSVVVLDAAATVHTPDWLWHSSGIRAVDHAVGDICSINVTPFSEAAAIRGLSRLQAGLRCSKAYPSDLAARLECLTGAWLAMVGGQTGVDKGASHAIGHVLGGAASVLHGHTSCVLLPAVLQFNRPINRDRQSIVSAAFGDASREAADYVAALIAALEMPQRLSDVGIRKEQLPEIAEKTMKEKWVHTNPRRIPDSATVMSILESAW
ncbi:MAG: maleylacetate reductase [Mesorhizobium sp.]|uniref:iron-containing alcohol dehydrogenase n=1 Tax=Mesorhizobium sp. TaxID=1871066 RepID=UPI000FE93DE7|nr:iron-containing alcohol dehydrogenase [Mesorhizobium sp.]RWI54724.1 MAG: maleylacetate reductase [Mesorhizobium sp.]